jgi:hypothetical protein
MRSARSLVALAVVLAACSTVRVTTVLAPDANLGSLHTFRVMNAPIRRGTVSAAPTDPMLENSINNRVLRQHIASAFTSRGYAVDAANPDFTVAFYASLHGKLDVTAWDYGYRGRWGGWREGPGMVTVEPYVEGTVIVDVVDAKTQELVWRGRGVSDVSENPETYSQSLNRTVMDIVKKFPSR